MLQSNSIIKEFGRWLLLTIAWALGTWAFAWLTLTLLVKLYHFLRP